MITVNYSDNEYINYIEVSGHAMYAKHGKDIVCASVSSMVIYAFNLCYTFDENVVIIQEENLLSIKILNKSEMIEVVLKTLIVMLKELETDYKNYINILRR